MSARCNSLIISKFSAPEWPAFRTRQQTAAFSYAFSYNAQMQPATQVMRSAAIAVIGVIFFALLYFGAYIAMGTRSISGTVEAQVYRHQWQATVFEPAAKAESIVRQQEVFTASTSDFD